MIPPLLNDFIALMKDTALVSRHRARRGGPGRAATSSRSSSTASVLTLGAILFLIVTIPLARLIDWLIARQQRRRRARRRGETARRPGWRRRMSAGGRRCCGSKAVHKRFGALEVLRGVDLEVDQGKVVCVLGPSGSGKSTLLRCINLLEPPDEGEIYLEGKNICAIDPRPEEDEEGIDFVRRRVGIVFQQFNLFPNMSALENVSLAQQKVLRRSAAEARAKGTALLGRVGLSDKVDEYPDRLSGRPAAAGRDRAGAGDGPARDALRRGHQRARPGAGQGGARRDARARLGGDDDDRRHPRDGVRPRRRRRGRLHGRGRRSSSRARRPRCSRTRSRSARSASSGWC